VCELTGALGQAGVSLGLAFTGFGVWSIVFGQIAGSALQSGLAWAVAPFHPDPRKASWSLLRELVRYGRYVSATNILNIANNTADNVTIGRVLGATSLGFYAVAFRLADFPNTVISHIVGRVMFPIYSLLQNELVRFRRAYIQNLQRIAVLALPVSVTLLVCAEPIVLGLFGQKWRSPSGRSASSRRTGSSSRSRLPEARSSRAPGVRSWGCGSACSRSCSWFLP
jgi:PST family polysaccharide transporter